MNERTQAIWEWFNGAPFRILVIFIVALIGQVIGNRAIDRGIGKLAATDLRPGPGTAKRQAERARTIGTVFSSAFNAAVWIIAIGMILGEFGFNLGPVIASAGVIGVALGLGAQTIVRDVLSGIFMLVEDQYGVGDEIHVQEVEGKVEKVGLRITQVRDKKGVLWFLRNGEILVVGNKSKN
ncbi:MscS Small-conductance mechanosensitive channel [Candidatus Nanopelagicaceae bacterium]|jgi:small-conductance mechanosensitive channel